MADEGAADEGLVRKQEEDYTAKVDEDLPVAVAKASGGDLRGAIDGLLPLEKKARIASDSKSTARICAAIVTMCFDAGDWDVMCESIIMLTKRRGALKMAVTKMVQTACDCLEKSPNMETTLKLIDTLRTCTAGKIHVEIERARLTMKLSKIKEAEGNIPEAADVLQELQVETYGTMERKEKVEFILEQMRLGLARKDYIRTQILSKKVSGRYLDKEEAQDLKLKFFRIMIDCSLHDGNYLDVCKHNRAIFDTPGIQADEAAWQAALRDAVVYAVLSPYDNEQSDLVARIAAEKKLEEMPVVNKILQKFITSEIMSWKAVDAEFGAELQGSTSFDLSTDAGKKRYEDLKNRVVEHNIRTIGKYYTRCSISRLASLLELPMDETEACLSKLVENKTVFAKIHRPKGIISFRSKKDASEVLQDWSHSNNELMRSVGHAAHVIEKEKIANAAK